MYLYNRYKLDMIYLIICQIYKIANIISKNKNTYMLKIFKKLK